MLAVTGQSPAAIFASPRSIRHPELLDSPASGLLVRQVLQDVSPFHQVSYAAILMAGSGPLRAALAEKPAPAKFRADIEDFAEALAASEDQRTTD